MFADDFENFLRYAIKHSGCNLKAVEHVKYSAVGYVFNGKIEAFERDLQ